MSAASTPSATTCRPSQTGLAFGGPGIPARWTRSDKQGVGTAYSAASRLWFTLAQGIVSEIYYPTIDLPQIRDLQLLFTDGESFFHEERHHMEAEVDALDPAALGYRIRSRAPGDLYQIEKQIISDPHLDCLLVHVRIHSVAEQFQRRLRCYVLCAPHLAGAGAHNNAAVVNVAGRMLLSASKPGTFLVLGANQPFTRLSCGYVGSSDGWTDVATHRGMQWEFQQALDGNVALTGEVDLSRGLEFTLALAMGDTLHSAVNALQQSLATPFEQSRARFITQWRRAAPERLPLGAESGDGGELYQRSVHLLLAHEDKTYPGALIASLSIPWGEAMGDDDQGGYHLVWTRDMVNSATGLLAAGVTATPLRALIYLSTSQRDDGGFYQNFWIDGEPYWRGVQLDETAFPVLLAWRLQRANALREFDPMPLVHGAMRFLLLQGPITAQERWEECSGYSPSTLAAVIAGVTCAAALLRERGHASAADFVQEYADFLSTNLERWTVTTKGTLLPDVARHYIRILPAPADGEVCKHVPDPNTATVRIANRPPGADYEFPAREVVDAGFLELVRHGIRRPDDQLMLDSLRVVDRILKADTPSGPCWRRYNHDGYGQRADGSPFQGWGRGRAWPLLTGERAHYELAAGNDARPLRQAMENFSHGAELLPEQVWDSETEPPFVAGAPTGSAMPLMWAHAEYIKLLRSLKDGVIFDCIPEVYERYAGAAQLPRSDIEFWTFHYPVAEMAAGRRLRVIAATAFTLHWSRDDWSHTQDTLSECALQSLHFVDLPAPREGSIRFTFRWEGGRWEGRDWQVQVV